MCGRYDLGATIDEIVERFGVPAREVSVRWTPRYNVAPSQLNPVIVGNGHNHLKLMQWGLVPSWSKDGKANYSTINARAETAASKAAYRKPLASQRCLVPATGYFEWAEQAAHGATRKQPFRVTPRTGQEPAGLFAFAGLYDVWHSPDGQAVETYTIMTTQAGPGLTWLHHRTPVILSREAEGLWLDSSVTDVTRLVPLFHPLPDDALVAYPVSPAVGNPANDGPQLVEPVPAAGFQE